MLRDMDRIDYIDVASWRHSNYPGGYREYMRRHMQEKAFMRFGGAVLDPNEIAGVVTYTPRDLVQRKEVTVLFRGSDQYVQLPGTVDEFWEAVTEWAGVTR